MPHVSICNPFIVLQPCTAAAAIAAEGFACQAQLHAAGVGHHSLLQHICSGHILLPLRALTALLRAICRCRE
jgi:hypothetical protein